MNVLKKIYFNCLWMAIAANTHAQNVETAMQPLAKLSPGALDTLAKLKVRSIKISGNKKTKDYLVLREIQFKPGDSITISKLNEAFQLARQQIYNTTLFHSVKVDLAMVSAYDIDVLVTVAERWYLFPAPEFKVVDRSFNEWLVKYKADLKRVNYGVKFVHNNFSGRRDPLLISLINGYTKNMSFSYSQPYSNNGLTQGFGIGGGFSQNRETDYKTSSDNKILFYKNKDFVKKNIYANLSLGLQRGILTRHLFSAGFSKVTVSDSVLSELYNPNYFNSNTTSKSLVDLSYTYQYTNVNNINYPLKGATGYVTLFKRGLQLTGGINLFSIEGAFNKYWAHPHNWFTSLQFVANIKFPFDQPYINQKAIGYGNANLRGLEYYVIDGVAFGIIKTGLKKKIVSFSIPVPFKSRIVPNLPFTIFAKTYADAGFAYNKKKFGTNLNNRFLYTGGFGIDILTLYDINLKLEYSFNQLGQHSFFFENR